MQRHKNEAVKVALRDYAKQVGVEIPRGFVVNPAFGPAAIKLTKRIQRRSKIKPTGEITPETLLVVGRWLPGSSVGQRAAWAMVAMEGPLEIYGNNMGPYVQQIQRLGSELSPGAWPWCAAAVSWALRCAGWRSWAAFVKSEPEAWVPGWVDAARAGRYGLSVVPWRASRAGDVSAWRWDSAVHQHIGMLMRRPGFSSGVALTVEGNTSSGSGGSQDDGGGMWRRERDVRPPHVVIRVS